MSEKKIAVELTAEKWRVVKDCLALGNERAIAAEIAAIDSALAKHDHTARLERLGLPWEHRDSDSNTLYVTANSGCRPNCAVSFGTKAQAKFAAESGCMAALLEMYLEACDRGATITELDGIRIEMRKTLKASGWNDEA